MQSRIDSRIAEIGYVLCIPDGFRLGLRDSDQRSGSAIDERSRDAQSTRNGKQKPGNAAPKHTVPSSDGLVLDE